MLHQNPVEGLFCSFNKIFPSFNLQPENFSGFFIKNIKTTECTGSIKRVSGKQSGQYHIAVTGENMKLFPLLTSFEYYEYNETAHKQTVIADYPLSFFVPNLIFKVKYIIDNYDSIETQLDRNDPKEQFILSKDSYKHLLQDLESMERKSLWLDTTLNVVVGVRGTGQNQIELGPSPTKYTPEFKMFRTLFMAGDHLVVAKKKANTEYVLLLISDELFTTHGLNHLGTFYKDSNGDKMAILPQRFSDESPKNDTSTDESNIFFYFLDEVVPSLDEIIEINFLNDGSFEDCKLKDLIYFYNNNDDQKCFIAIGEIQEVNIEEKTINNKVRIIRNISNIPIQYLIAEGYIDAELFDSEKIEEGEMNEDDPVDTLQPLEVIDPTSENLKVSSEHEEESQITVNRNQ